MSNINNSNENLPNRDGSELAKLRKLLNILLSVSAILAVVLITLGVSKIIKIAKTPNSGVNIPILITISSESTTYTEPVVYHTEQLQASELADSYWRPLPEIPEEDVKTPEHFEVRGLYVGTCSNIDYAIELCKNSELNAVVINLKQEYGTSRSLPFMVLSE